MSETAAEAFRDRLRRIIGHGVFVQVEKFLDEMEDLARSDTRVSLNFAYNGQPEAAETSPPIRMPFAATIRAADGGYGAARTAATSDSVWTLYRDAEPDGAGTAVATLTFTAADSAPLLATTGGTDQAIAEGDFVWAVWGAQDATLADLSCSVIFTKAL